MPNVALTSDNPQDIAAVVKNGFWDHSCAIRVVQGETVLIRPRKSDTDKYPALRRLIIKAKVKSTSRAPKVNDSEWKETSKQYKFRIYFEEDSIEITDMLDKDLSKFSGKPNQRGIKYSN